MEGVKEMARRGENIHKRKDGRWEARIIFRYSSDGKACYRYLYGKTYQEAKNKRNALLAELHNTSNVTSSYNKLKITFEQLMLEWLKFRKDTVKESTYANYINLFERHLNPDLGKYYLTSLTTEYIDAYLKEKLKSGRVDKKGGLSPKTVADIRSVLLMVIEYARSRKYPCAVDCNIFCPSVASLNIQVLTKGEQEKLEQVLFKSKDPLCLGVLLALYGGLRIGEVCALQWSDINLEDATLQINKKVIRIRDLTPDSPKKTKIIIDKPKTVNSIRTVPLPAFLINHLKPFQQEPDIYLLTGKRTIMEPRVCLAKYKKLLIQANLNDFTFHTLRHTFATRCVESGFDAKSLSEILGHANVNTTLQRYVHPSMDLKRKQMERLASISVQSHNK